MYFIKSAVSKTGSQRLSKSYIDAYGNVVFFEPKFTKIKKGLSLAIKEFPPKAIFMISALIFVEFYILIGGIFYHSSHPLQIQDLRIYLFLFVFIGLAIGSLLLLAWLFIEHKQKNTISKTRYFSDLESYSLD